MQVGQETRKEGCEGEEQNEGDCQFQETFITDLCQYLETFLLVSYVGKDTTKISYGETMLWLSILTENVHIAKVTKPSSMNCCNSISLGQLIPVCTSCNNLWCHPLVTSPSEMFFSSLFLLHSMFRAICVILLIVTLGLQRSFAVQLNFPYQWIFLNLCLMVYLPL